MHHTEDIERLFSNKFNSFEVKTSKAEWISLNAKLKRLNFLKFSFANFNIYYLSIILVLAGSSAYLTIHNTTLKKKIQQLESQVQSSKMILPSAQVDKKLVVVPDESEIICKPSETNTPTTDVYSKSKSVLTSKRTAVSISNLVKTDTIKPVRTENSAKDSVKSVAGIPVDSTIRIRKVKKTVYIKPGSVVLKDTIVVPKP
jgi:hypothetical protein